MLSVVGEGLPLIYNGQEAGNVKRLEFFEKDPIVWKPHTLGDLYTKLFALKKANTALWNAAWGARMIRVPNSNETHVLSFVRQNQQDKVFAVINFSAETQTITCRDGLYYGNYTDFFSRESLMFNSPTSLTLAPWSYRVFVK